MKDREARDCVPRASPLGLASVVPLHGGVVTVVQRFRSDLGLVTDGAFEARGEELPFLAAPPPQG